MFFQNAFSDDALKELGMLARKVTDALQDLLRYYIRDIEGRLKGGKYEDQIEMILAATERLINSLGNAQETVKSAKTVAMVKPIGNQSFIVLIFCGLFVGNFSNGFRYQRRSVVGLLR